MVDGLPITAIQISVDGPLKQQPLLTPACSLIGEA
jgi:hypothetical protein